MIRELLGTTGQTEVESRMASGLPIYEMMEQIRLELRRSLGEEHALLFAEPNANAQTGQIRWYASTAGAPRPLIDLAGEERQVAEARLARLTTEIEAHAARLRQSGNPQDQHIAKALDDALQIPRETDIFVVGQQPVIAAWGHVLHGQGTRRPILRTLAEKVKPPAPVAERPAPPPSPPPPVVERPAPPPPPVIEPKVAPPPPASVIAPPAPASVPSAEPGTGSAAAPAPAVTARPGSWRRSVWWLVLMLLVVGLVAAALYRFWPRPPEPPSIPDRSPLPVPEPTPRPVPEPRVGQFHDLVYVWLSWDGRDQLDLEIVCPGGQVIRRGSQPCESEFYEWSNAERTGSGALRVWIDINKAPAGRYRVRVRRSVDRPPVSANTSFEIKLHFVAFGGRAPVDVRGVLSRSADGTMRDVLTFDLPSGATQPIP